MTFDVVVLDLCADLPEPRGNLANFFRGQLGAALRRSCTCVDPLACPRSCAYGRIFDPPRDLNAPSGLRDPLRPFVLRALQPGRLSLHLFDRAAAPLIIDALKPVSWSMREVQCDLQPRTVREQALEIRFVTPTDLRTPVPDFATVFARARDRVSTLRTAYGPGPLEIGFKVLGEKAREVRLTGSDLKLHGIRRRSGSTGQVHPIGGFTGSAVYEGSFSDFLPILQAARYTGIGRRTVWGNGEISVRLF